MRSAATAATSAPARELERLADPAVQRAAAAERQPVVGGVAQQAVAEGETALAVGDQEAVEALEDRLGAPASSSSQRGHEAGAREARAHHRGLPQHAAIGARELVDLQRHQRLDRLRERVVVRPCAHGARPSR